MAISRLQSVAMISGTVSITRTYASATTAHSLLVGTWIAFGTVGTITISDNGGNTWVVGDSGVVTGNGVHFGIATSTNIAGGNTPTVTFGAGAGSSIQLAIAEYSSGVVGSYLKADQTNANQGSGTSASSGNITTTSANELLEATYYLSGTSPTDTGGFTNWTSVINGQSGADQIVSSIGTYAATGTQGSANWGAMISSFLIFNPAGGSSGSWLTIAQANSLRGVRH